ncbi:MAG: DUF2812 domain-containing protein [Ruminococcaceae bacterium]|nr:DUF2812 domain-containing protein [Oscillospiraceae bacterium]
MRKVVHKIFLAWQFEEEEKWLNKMALDGWVLADVGFCRYEFEPCEKGEYQYKLEYLENSTGSKESLNYINFIEETGAEYVGNYMRWVYFRKKTAGGEEFDIYSDTASKKKYFDRIVAFLKIIAVLNLIVGIGNIIIALLNHTFANSMGIINLLLAAFIYQGYKKIDKKAQKLAEDQILFDN